MEQKSRPVVGADGNIRTPKREDELNKIFAGVFSGQGGKEVIRYLRSITIESVAGPAINSNELMHKEGQRFIVGIIEQRIARGQNER